VDPLSVVAVVAMLTGVGIGWHSRRQVRRIKVEAAGLRGQLSEAYHAASHDPLTGLPNRRAFYQLGTALISNPAQHPLAAAVIDLDDFKNVNDRYGHAAGDEVLETVALRLATSAGTNYLVARLGGDEFAALLCVPATDQATMDLVSRALAHIVGEPIRVGSDLIAVTASVGVVPVYPSSQLSDALRRADIAMYQTKATSRKACVRLIDPFERPRIRGTHATPAHTRHLVDNAQRAEAGG
jgi:diguanylate cyclase